MCGRYTLATNAQDMAARFRATLASEGGGWPPRYNVAPTQLVPAVITVATVDEAGARRLERMRWGLIPRWARDPKIGSRLINARAETLAEKPAFRDALKGRRCLIPADGFYEWAALEGSPQAGQEGSAGGRNGKRPMRVTLKSGEPFAFAGLWDTWRSPLGEEVRSCTIITCAPNALMAHYHHRMPAILAPEAEAAWLDPSVTDPSVLLPLLVPYPAELMTAYAVSPLVNSPASEGPQLALPLSS